MKGSPKPCGAHLVSFLFQRTAVRSCIDHTFDPSEAVFFLRAWSITVILSKLKLFGSSIYNSKWKHNCFFLWVTCSSYCSYMYSNPCLLWHGLYFVGHPHILQWVLNQGLRSWAYHSCLPIFKICMRQNARYPGKHMMLWTALIRWLRVRAVNQNCLTMISL